MTNSILPLAFVRSSPVNLYNGHIYSTGANGYAWSRTSYSSYSGYYLYFNTANVDPSDNGDRYVGHSLRCLYPGR